MTYELKTEKFTGPLDALLALIEERKLDITQISLAEVTEDFLRFVKDLKQEVAEEDVEEKGAEAAIKVRAHLGLLADFIVVASRLVLMKSKYLLPGLEVSPEEEEEMRGLEKRLRLYRSLRPAMKIISSLWKTGKRQHARSYFLNPSAAFGDSARSAFFYPDEKVGAQNLSASLSRLFEILEKYSYETDTIREKIRTLEEEMSDIVTRLQGAGESSLSQLSMGRSRSEVVLAFLAILHLARDQKVFVRQEERFSDILIESEDTSSSFSKLPEPEGEAA